ncbi:MAG TPA: zinc metalloprotease HtpX [Tepidisphaeraceae bacterium]|nr:zinc metalloprotease HtpX [Tepidisphaeraceae bacterium]
MMSKLYNNVKTAVLLGLMTALILFIGSFFGRGGLMIAMIFAAVSNFVAYFFSDKIALMTMQAKEVGPEHELYRIVEPLARRAEMPMPRVYVSPAAAPNAFATGRNPRNAAVCATAGLLQMLNRDEIAGVMAHELAHVKHRDILIASVAATIAGAISALGYFFMFGGAQDDEGDSHPIAGLLTMLLGPVAAGLIQAAISRSREFNADKEGAAICGNPMYLASALEKIHAAAHQVPLPVNPAMNGLFIAEPFNPVRSVANLFQTHPPLEQRLMNLIGRETTGRFGSARGGGGGGGRYAYGY